MLYGVGDKRWVCCGCEEVLMRLLKKVGKLCNEHGKEKKERVRRKRSEKERVWERRKKEKEKWAKKKKKSFEYKCLFVEAWVYWFIWAMLSCIDICMVEMRLELGIFCCVVEM